MDIAEVRHSTVKVGPVTVFNREAGVESLPVLLLLRGFANSSHYFRHLMPLLRNHQPPLLAIWGKNDTFFIPLGAEAFKRDVPDAVVKFLDAGHFALETHVEDIASAILEMPT
jgi:pimeloyl-ACP methyl ester carboxylesterase